MKFAQTSLITSSGHLSKAHMDYLQGLQEAINKQDPQAIAANNQVNDAVHTVQQEMKLTGIDLNPEAGSDREKQLAKTESGLRDRIIAAQQAKNGTPLSSDEVQNLAMGYFADQVLKGGVAGEGGDGKQPQAQGGQKGAAPGTKNAGHPQAKPDSQQIFTSPFNIMPHGAPEAAGTMSDQKAHDAHPDDHVNNHALPTLALGEFNSYVKAANNLEQRSKQAVQDKKKMVVTPEEQKQLQEMQQRLGIKQTGKYDNATRHALQSAFIDLIRPAAEEQEKKYGIPAAITIGQAILESGYGRHIPTDIKTGERSNNFFGIKARKDQQAVNSWTHEYDKNKNLVRVIQPFAVYDNINDSIERHSELLKNDRYKKLFSSADPEKWAQGLQDAGYGGKDNKTYADALIKSHAVEVNQIGVIWICKDIYAC